MTNSIRPCRLASLRAKGEARTCEKREAYGAEGLGEKATMGSGEVVGVGRHRRPATLSVETCVEHAGESRRIGVRALIVAMKPGNAGGAKGCRKVET
jgi:hypothetical protein